jgi:glutamyl-tRNA synthetase
MSNVRTRFAPSPTGGLHLGGVRTALFSYLYAKKHKGQFVLRIEDTDQNRYVEGAEQYIIDCLTWCGIAPDEGPHVDGGEHHPYRQSERKETYKQYAQQLVDAGHAYYAFDTQEELEAKRAEVKLLNEHGTFQYDSTNRLHLNNSLRFTKDEVAKLINEGVPYVIRIKMPENELITFQDMIRGEISNESSLVDDKVLLKADGMPTYHLAVVVDDYLMKITHAFRGEEWLPSAPVHIKLWEYLGWKNEMPQWAHLPLILKPDGNGKLSKRDGDRLGFPVFAMNWTDPKTNELATGFKELGFLPEAFINLLAMLGWSSGEEKELFSKEELIQLFSMDRVHKGGAKFDFEKAKWFNHEWIKHQSAELLLNDVKAILVKHQVKVSSDEALCSIVSLVKDRCTLLGDFYTQSVYFFESPKSIEIEAIQPKWNDDKKNFFIKIQSLFNDISDWNMNEIETCFKQLATEMNIKVGELQLPFRIMLVGGKFGPGVFQIAEMIGKENTIERINTTLNLL